MTTPGKTKETATASKAREGRLKAALKANLQRRKAQSRARTGKDKEKEAE